ncbi:hypothetical protein ACFQ60_38190 [Streptomyces zhihengii]
MMVERSPGRLTHTGGLCWSSKSEETDSPKNAARLRSVARLGSVTPRSI